MIIVIRGAFLFFLISFGAKDAVYMNRVIIPDEKVRIVTNEIHLVVEFLNSRVVDMIDIVRIKIARLIGFVFLVPMIMMIAISEVMVLYFAFDLQNQCSVFNF
jgi:hypothetical protein